MRFTKEDLLDAEYQHTDTGHSLVVYKDDDIILSISLIPNYGVSSPWNEKNRNSWIVSFITNFPNESGKGFTANYWTAIAKPGISGKEDIVSALDILLLDYSMSKDDQSTNDFGSMSLIQAKELLRALEEIKFKFESLFTPEEIDLLTEYATEEQVK